MFHWIMYLPAAWLRMKSNGSRLLLPKCSSWGFEQQWSDEALVMVSGGSDVSFSFSYFVFVELYNSIPCDVSVCEQWFGRTHDWMHRQTLISWPKLTFETCNLAVTALHCGPKPSGKTTAHEERAGKKGIVLQQQHSSIASVHHIHMIHM